MGAIGSNDAKGCYDRIPQALASLALRALGYPPQPITSMFTTLQKMQQHIRSFHGDSEIFYDGTDDDLPSIIHNGKEVKKLMSTVGQGNGAGCDVNEEMNNIYQCELTLTLI